MQPQKSGYWSRVWAALVGRDLGDEAPQAAQTGEDGTAELRSRVAALEMDVRERDERIERMQGEYAALELARHRAAAGAGQEELEKLFKRLAGPLASLMALVSMRESGQEVAAADLTQLVRDLEKELVRAGLESIGRAGEATEFNVALHQRMSGGTVHAGSPVTVRVPGYRMGEKVLMKAMVSTRE